MNLWWAENSEDLARKGAALFWETAKETLGKKPHFSIVISGGNTPKRMFEVIAERASKDKLRWNDIHFFWADERFVPIQDKDNNYSQANRILLSHLNIDPKNIHRIPTELRSAEDCAKKYEADIRDFFHLSEFNPLPQFDMAFLGVGTDGHTASLFPNSPEIAAIENGEINPLVISSIQPSTQQWRISLTPMAFQQCPCIVFLVSGKEKAKIVSLLLTAKDGDNKLPAQKIHSNVGDVLLIADQAALGDLDFSLAG